MTVGALLAFESHAQERRLPAFGQLPRRCQYHSFERTFQGRLYSELVEMVAETAVF
jgi:hypothetical protein